MFLRLCGEEGNAFYGCSEESKLQRKTVIKLKLGKAIPGERKRGLGLEVLQ